MHRIGIIAGSFDVLHPGYIKMFKDAKSVCDDLVVLLNKCSDAKQYDKPIPICSVHERRERLLAIKYIDEIMTYDSENELYDMLSILARAEDDREYIRILGTDYKNKPFTGDDLQMKVHFHDRSQHGWSTTIYKELIAASLKMHKKGK